ncbi:MAG: DMT family transporter, partial [Pseudomonadota bacterium]
MRPALIPTLAWVAVFTAMWGVIEHLGLGFGPDISLQQVVVMRYGVHLALILAFCLLLRRSGFMKSKHLALQLLRGACMFVMPASFIMLTTGAGAANLWSVFWVMPIIVCLLAALWLGERVTPIKWLWAFVGYIGALMVLGVNYARLDAAAMMPLAGAISFAAYIVISRRIREEPVLTSLFYTGLVAFLCMLPWALTLWQPVPVDSYWRVLAVGAVGLVMLLALERTLHLMSAASVAPLLFGALGSEILIEIARSGDLPSRRVFAGA